MDFRIICFKNKSWHHRPSAFYQQNRYRLRSHIAHMGSGRCQTQTDTKPIAIYVKSYSSCVPIHCRHMNIQLHLNFSSRALLKSCCVPCSKFSFSQLCSAGPDFFFWMGRPSTFYLQNRYSLRIHLSRIGCGQVPVSDRYKTDSNL